MSYRASIRGGYAPRRGRGGGLTKGKPKPDLQKRPLGELLEMFRSEDLGSEEHKFTHETRISDVHYVASYNWLNYANPTIMVPGEPPQWTPHQHAPRLQEDSGQYFRDPNAARYPDYPMAPVVRAIIDMYPDHTTLDVDLVACGSTLGNLLRFSRGDDRAFRFDIEVIGNSVLFIRRENDPKEIIPDVHGFGHSFPEAYTTWAKGVKASETHQRIIKYDFADLRCLVRFECDGYLRKTSSTGPSDTWRSRKSPDSPEVDLNDILDGLNTTSIVGSDKTRDRSTKGFGVEAGGSIVQQETIFDLKTRSRRYNKAIDMTDIYPMLWIKQVPNFIVAYHDGAGKFEDIRVQDIRAKVREWERENISGIQKFAVLLRMIVAYARSSESLLEVYCPGPDRLEIRKQCDQDRHALPQDLLTEWVRKNEPISRHQHDPDEDGFDDFDIYDSGDDWKSKLDDDDGDPDYTACSAEDCGYCGRCTY